MESGVEEGSMDEKMFAFCVYAQESGPEEEEEMATAVQEGEMTHLRRQKPGG